MITSDTMIKRAKGAHVPNNPSKAPNVPTGPQASAKGNKSKVMAPMSKVADPAMGSMPPQNSSTVNPKSQSQTVQGGPKS